MAISIAKMLGAEFLGTYLLVLTLGCGAATDAGVLAVLSVAAVLMVLTYSLVSVSGAIFNPAVTFAIYVARLELDAFKVLSYMVVQLAGGICAGVTCVNIFDRSVPLVPGDVPASMAEAKAAAPGQKAHFGHFDVSQVGLVEVVYTYVICLVVLRAAIKARSVQKDSESFGVAIGGVVVAGGYAGKWISGACFNPAVAFGLDMSSGLMATAKQGGISGQCFVYATMEFIAALWAGLTHTFLESNVSPATKKLVCELIGTFVLVLTIILNVLQEKNEAAALSIGAGLMAASYALGPVCGGHFNPAVTTALACGGKFDLGLAAPYVAAQLAGAFVAWESVGAVLPASPSVGLGPGRNFTWGSVVFAEGVFSFLLCFVMLNVTTLAGEFASGKRRHLLQGGKSTQVYGVAAGACMVVGRVAVGRVSGGVLNPAAAAALAARGLGEKPVAAYGLVGAAGAAAAFAAAELAGAVVAAAAFRGLRGPGGPLQLEDAKDYGSV